MAGEEREGSVVSSQNTFKGYVRIKKKGGRVSKGCKVGQHLKSL